MDRQKEKAGRKRSLRFYAPSSVSQRHTGLMMVLNNVFAQDIDMGVLPTLYAAVGPDVNGTNYYGPGGFMEMKGYPKKVESNELSKDERIAEKLWDVSEELTGVRFLDR